MSDFKIDKEGNWYYRGMEMSRRDIVILFYRHLLRDELGRFFIDNGKQRCQVDVEDTAFVVRAVYGAAGESRSEDRVCVLLSDDSIEELDSATLRIGECNVPYCRVKKGSFDARFSTSGYYQLAEHIRHDSGRNQYYIFQKGERYYFADVQNSK